MMPCERFKALVRSTQNLRNEVTRENLEQLAERVETYGSDQRACIRKRWVTGRQAVEAGIKANVYEGLAEEFRRLKEDFK